LFENKILHLVSSDTGTNLRTRILNICVHLNISLSLSIPLLVFGFPRP